MRQFQQITHAAPYSSAPRSFLLPAACRFGVRFARKFLDAREVEGDGRALMNLHNNRAGRRVSVRGAASTRQRRLRAYSPETVLA